MMRLIDCKIMMHPERKKEKEEKERVRNWAKGVIQKGEHASTPLSSWTKGGLLFVRKPKFTVFRTNSRLRAPTVSIRCITTVWKRKDVTRLLRRSGGQKGKQGNGDQKDKKGRLSCPCLSPDARNTHSFPFCCCLLPVAEWIPLSFAFAFVC